MNKLLVLGLGLVLLIALGCVSSPNSKLVIGFQSTPASALAQVAAEKGFFIEEGLNVEIQEFTAGKFALQAFLAKSLDFAVVGDVPIVLASMQGNDFKVLTEMGSNDPEDPVLVRDEGIDNPKEYFLKTKRKLSTSLGGTPEFSTYQFLKHYEIPSSQVEIVAQKPEDTPAALSSGSVDAISIFEPYPSIAEEALPGETKRFTLPKGVYVTKYVLVTHSDWVQQHPQEAKKIMQALEKAKQFIEQNPLEAQQIVSKRSKFDLRLIQKSWSSYTFETGFSDQLLQNWQAEAQWAMDTNKVKAQPIPNFTSLLVELN